MFEHQEHLRPVNICLKVRREGTLLIVLSAAGQIEFLNETASFFLELADGIVNINYICEKMLLEYDVGKVDLESDLMNLVKDLQWKRVIRLADCDG